MSEHKPPTGWDSEARHHALAEVRPQESGLRAALERLDSFVNDLLDGYDWVGTGSSKSGAIEEKIERDRWADIRAALAAVPAPPEPLDVEALWRALGAHADAASDEAWDHCARSECAEAIAAAYEKEKG